MSEVRTCYKCQVERPLKMFYVGIENRRAEREGRSQWRMHCRSCQQTINTARRKPRQDHADAVKLAAGCADCGIKSVHPEIYDFDHTGDDKSDSVSQLMTKGSFEAFVAEIAKCEVVCANCHRIRTRSRQAVTFGRVRR